MAPRIKRASRPRPAARPTAKPPAKPTKITRACLAKEKKIIAAYTPLSKAYGNYRAVLSHNGRKMLFLSNRHGQIHQLYVSSTNNPTGKPTRIAPGTDTVFRARFTPDNRSIIFSRDSGGNKLFQLYRSNLSGTKVVALTKDPKKYHQYFQVSPDGKTLYFLRGSHRSPTGEIMSQPIGGGAGKVLARVHGFNWISDVSRDGKLLLISQVTSLSTSATLLLDIATGKLKKIAPPKGVRAHAHSSVFSTDGKSVYVATNQNNKNLGVHRIDIRTGKVMATYFMPKAEVFGLSSPRKGGPLPITTDMGTHRSVQLLHPFTLKPTTKVALPKGNVDRYGTMSEDGKRFLISISTPTRPSESYAIDAKTGRASRLRRDRQPGLAQLPKLNISVKYISSFDGTKIPTLVYLPKKIPAGKKLPVIVNVHGGPANSSVIKWHPRNAFFVSRGFAVVAPNVRGSSGFGKAYERADNKGLRMNAVRDLKAVADWIKKQRWADPNRLAIQGLSYGGYMVYMALGHQPKTWAAGVSAAGIVDLRTALLTCAKHQRRSLRAELGHPTRDAAMLKRLSPMTVIDRFRAPLLVWQGGNDHLVPRAEQERLVTALRKRGKPVEYMFEPGAGHGPTRRSHNLAYLARIVRFLEQHLKPTRQTKICRAPGN